MNPRAHLLLYVADQAASTAFYTAVLAEAPLLDVPGMTEFALPGGARLGLMPEAGIQRLLPGLEVGDARAARAELYLVTPDAPLLLERAVRAGGRLLAPMEARTWGATVGYVQDGDGHVLAFAQEP